MYFPSLVASYVGQSISICNKEYSKQGVLIRGVPAVLFIEVSSFQGVLIRGVPVVLFIEVSSFQGVLIRGVPAVLFIKVPSFHGVSINRTAGSPLIRTS